MKKIFNSLGILSIILALSSCNKDVISDNSADNGAVIKTITLNASYGNDTKALAASESNGNFSFKWELGDYYTPVKLDVWTDKGYSGQITLQSVVSDGRGGVFTGSVSIASGSSKIIFCYGCHQNPWGYEYCFERYDSNDDGTASSAAQTSFPYLEKNYSSEISEYAGVLVPKAAIVKLDLSSIYPSGANSIYLKNETCGEKYFPAGYMLMDYSSNHADGQVECRDYDCSYIELPKDNSNLSAYYLCLNATDGQVTYGVYSDWNLTAKIGEFSTPAGGLQAGTFYTLDGNGKSIPVNSVE